MPPPPEVDAGSETGSESGEAEEPALDHFDFNTVVKVTLILYYLVPVLDYTNFSAVVKVTLILISALDHFNFNTVVKETLLPSLIHVIPF